MFYFKITALWILIGIIASYFVVKRNMYKSAYYDEKDALFETACCLLFGPVIIILWLIQLFSLLLYNKFKRDVSIHKQIMNYIQGKPKATYYLVYVMGEEE